MKVKHSQLKELIRRYYEKKIPLMTFGSFGIGKSQVMKETAKETAREKGKEFIEWDKISSNEKRALFGNTKNKFIFADLRASMLNPEDIRGLPSFNGEKNFVDWKADLLFSILSEKEADGFLFFDEINTASPMVMNSLMKIFLDRAVGEMSLSNEVGIFSAGNRFQDRANIYEIPDPLKDRMGEVELLVPDLESWTSWALKNNVDSRVLAFLNFKPTRLYHVDRKENDKSSTPRGWFRVSKLIENVDNLEELELLSASAIGEATSIEFQAFLKLQRKINIKQIIDNPESVKEIKEIDLKYSLLSTATEYYKKNKNKRIFEKLFEVCNNLEVEFGVLLLRFIYAVDIPFFKKEILNEKIGNKFFESYQKYLT